jgi:hypothetical protein
MCERYIHFLLLFVDIPVCAAANCVEINGIVMLCALLYSLHLWEPVRIHAMWCDLR